MPREDSLVLQIYVRLLHGIHFLSYELHFLDLTLDCSVNQHRSQTSLACAHVPTRCLTLMFVAIRLAQLRVELGTNLFTELVDSCQSTVGRDASHGTMARVH